MTGRRTPAPCWCPLGRRRSCTDNQHFEALTAAVFCARFDADIVRRRWPAIRRGFAGFDLAAVASWKDDQVQRLMCEPGMIHNRKKIAATIRNAGELARIADRYGSVRAYVRHIRRRRLPLTAEVDRWAHYVGAPSIQCYLRCAGVL